jgi:hypothetical protein
MSHISVDLIKLYKAYFGGHYRIDPGYYNPNYEEYFNQTAHGISILKEGALEGKTIFFPLRLWLNDSQYLDVDCATIRITTKKAIIKTPVARRIGTVKEQYAAGDYVFTINGLLIEKHKTFPDVQVYMLKYLYERKERIELRHAFAEIFFINSDKSDEETFERTPVIIESLEFPERVGMDLKHVPFTLVCETDFSETLIYDEQGNKQVN